jgi:hypothetical protein
MQAFLEGAAYHTVYTVYIVYNCWFSWFQIPCRLSMSVLAIGLFRSVKVALEFENPKVRPADVERYMGHLSID